MNEIKDAKEMLDTFLLAVEKYGKSTVVIPIIILGLKGLKDIKDLAKESITAGVPFEASFMGMSIKTNQPVTIGA